MSSDQKCGMMRFTRAMLSDDVRAVLGVHSNAVVAGGERLVAVLEGQASVLESRLDRPYSCLDYHLARLAPVRGSRSAAACSVKSGHERAYAHPDCRLVGSLKAVDPFVGLVVRKARDVLLGGSCQREDERRGRWKGWASRSGESARPSESSRMEEQSSRSCLQRRWARNLRCLRSGL